MDVKILVELFLTVRPVPNMNCVSLINYIMTPLCHRTISNNYS